jgi:D-beta-D-heptose 7-phosphate kinase/D-beta-D-heptose 1-phosphate adenosyltransferase
MILVIGDAMVDRYIDGRIRRMAQEAPIPVFEPEGDWRDYPGGAANVAANIEALGEKAVLVGGDMVSVKTRYVVGGNLVFRIDEDARDPIVNPRRVIAAAAAVIEHADAIVISDYGKGIISETVAAWVMAEMRASGLPLIVDPKPPWLMDAWRGATVVKLNEGEAAIVSERCGFDAFMDVKRASDMRRAFGCEAVVLTLGADGMLLYGGDDVREHIPAVAREVFDVVGAGDTVAAALAVGLSRGWGMLKAARFANAAAGVVVGKHGTATATMAEVEAALAATQK